MTDHQYDLLMKTIGILGLIGGSVVALAKVVKELFVYLGNKDKEASSGITAVANLKVADTDLRVEINELRKEIHENVPDLEKRVDTLEAKYDKMVDRMYNLLNK